MRQRARPDLWEPREGNLPGPPEPRKAPPESSVRTVKRLPGFLIGACSGTDYSALQFGLS